ncbi:hypothetical protein THAOC_08620 [Thalassiosira oceanica]|uniref:Uncharacterized protein n=1 Tax=Thalassiosira oceanica TaxID=159749 RepID=K0SUH6_THAOC|nr:hypothetical protein THAOC_08620 [Thalassiosira oceanica]|eukprot:EJK70058.1 hypothetical protein THAOC_08620 [Thalassiosira oceanica]
MNDQLAAVRKNQQDRWRSRPSNDPSSSRSKGGNGDKGHDEDDDEDDVICLSPPVQTSACNYNDEVVCLGTFSSGQGSLSAQIARTLGNKRKHLSDDDVSFDKCRKHTGVVAKVETGGGSYRLTDSHPWVQDVGGWLWARDSSYEKNFPSKHREDDPDDIGNLEAQFERAKKEKEKTEITHDFVVELAKKNGVLHGKWLLYYSPEYVVKGWTKIRDALFNGELGPSAKISVTPDGRHSVCVYCPNFTDSAELLRIRRGLASAGIYANCVSRFKLDAFTNLNIYGKNEFNIRATSFDCGGKNDPECKVLSYAEETCSGRVGCKKCFPCCLVVQEENEAKMAEEEKKRRALVKPLFPSWSQIDTRRAKPKFTFVEG